MFDSKIFSIILNCGKTHCMNEILDKDLIKNYLNGDEKSLEILINKYLVSIYNFVFSFVKEKDSSEDVTQEVFIKIWKKLKKFNI